MQNRLLKELADWATIPPDDLRERLEALIGRAPEDETVRLARRLFAQALEARGGLKIYTIHGFCERLLQRFPLEARVTPHFAVLDDRDQAEMRRAAFDAAIACAAENRDSALGQALARIIAVTSEDYFRKVVDAVLAKRAELARMMAHHDFVPTGRRQRLPRSSICSTSPATPSTPSLSSLPVFSPTRRSTRHRCLRHACQRREDREGH